MKLLLVSDLHYALKQFDWTTSVAPDFDVVIIAGVGVVGGQPVSGFRVGWSARPPAVSDPPRLATSPRPRSSMLARRSASPPRTCARCRAGGTGDAPGGRCGGTLQARCCGGCQQRYGLCANKNFIICISGQCAGALASVSGPSPGQFNCGAELLLNGLRLRPRSVPRPRNQTGALS